MKYNLFLNKNYFLFYFKLIVICIEYYDGRFENACGGVEVWEWVLVEIEGYEL